MEEREKVDEEILELDKQAADVLQHLEMRPKKLERLLMKDKPQSAHATLLELSQKKAKTT